ncbi:hypothetical protein [Rhizobium sp. CNPSo 4039]|uniref:glycosyltransferase n=1 Tax=Rhizobium sp. CNPSo 4039 TaxID=3021409 RepID=UPI00254EA0DE|nr:hypothetical protein [Rhizobium sp. CNPSo 4039]MDK4715909.1 hypothetical protein [Rhizobium sp. CNPSo 4039]
MSIVLFAWELGSNLGHIARDLPVALALRARGHSVYFACRDLTRAKEVLGPQGFSCMQAPALVPPKLSFMPASYAEILLSNGYGNGTAVKSLVAGWRQLFERVQVDVIICNHAPGAMLASRYADIPAVATCIGFELPPASPRTFREWEAPPVDRIMAAEQLVCRNLSQTLLDSGRQGIENTAQLFSSAAVLMTTFPELDHYGPREGLEYIGPVSYLLGDSYNWPRTDRKRIFAYLRNSVPNVEAILIGLQASSFEVLCVMPDCDPGKMTSYQSEHLHIQRDIVDVPSALRSCDLVVTYGTGTIHDALLSRCPVLMCPQNAEQYMVCSRVVRLGAGLLLPVGVAAPAISEITSILVSDPRFSAAAETFAARHVAFSAELAINRILQAVESRL